MSPLAQGLSRMSLGVHSALRTTALPLPDGDCIDVSLDPGNASLLSVLCTRPLSISGDTIRQYLSSCRLTVRRMGSLGSVHVIPGI